MSEWCVPFWVTFTLTSDLISRFSYLEHISFITNTFPQMCLMLDQFLWGHSSCYCDKVSFTRNIMAANGQLEFFELTLHTG